MKKTIVKISEGLGNQLFMYAHAYAFSKKMDYDLYVDATGFERRFTKDNEEIELNHHLVNSAWVYSLEYDGISPFTKSLARTNGWQ